MDESELESRWEARRAACGIDRAMRFGGEGLVLGAGTVLAHARTAARDLHIEVTDSRLLALLAAAHLSPATGPALSHLRRASEHWADGHDQLAAMHLALSGLSQLQQPVADAKRLFLADHLLASGFSADAVIKGLDLGAARNDLAKYNPDQPRVPAGNGRPSGQWTSGSASDQSSEGSDSATRRPVNAAAPGANITSAATSGSEGTAQSDLGSRFSVELPFAIAGSTPRAPALFEVSLFTDTVKAIGDATEIINSDRKWRELGLQGEAAIQEAVQARGWILLGTQVRVYTTAGLRIEDAMVRVPAGTAGNATTYDGFIEVKVNGGWYSTTQRLKDSLIGTSGGTLLTPVGGGYSVGQKIILETGLAVVTTVHTSL